MTPYQLVLFSPKGDERPARLRRTLERRFIDLGIPADFLAVISETEVPIRDRKAPIIAVYFGGSGAVFAPALRDLVAEAVTVVPVVSDLGRFTALVPAELHQYNGWETAPEDDDLESLAAVVLENFGLLRRSRRLFISYRRAETRGIAIQLYELLDAQAFDVFLDTVGVRPGEPFQEVLWHRLADTDVIVLLDSPDFLISRWTAEELARANTTNVQILQLVWPENNFQATAAFSRPIQLESVDYATDAQVGDTARLQSATLHRIAVEVESLRARALAARYAYLVQEFCSSARAAGFKVLPQYERYIVLEMGDGKRIVTVPSIGVPDAVRYHEVDEEAKGHSGDVVLLYDERGIRNKWIEHMRWLDRQLRVRSLQVTQVPTWLRGLVP